MEFSKAKLLIASSRAPHVTEVISTIRESIILIKYEYDTSSLSLIKELITSTLSSAISRVTSIAFLTHCSETSIFICNLGQKVISVESVRTDVEIRSFLVFLMTSAMTAGARRMDFFFSSSSNNTDGDPISRELQKFLQIPVRIWKDVTSPELSSRYNIGNLYFRIDELRVKLSSKLGENPLLEGYEKIRTVGKGAFGTAVLYKKVCDDSMVVIKEINMVDLTAAERQMALNEVQVLSILHHENIVRYLGSFERDGTLMIEMEYADQGTLAQMLARRTRKMEEKLVILLFSQIVEAIRYMHNHNVLHRDLKTANVFLHKDNRIKVGDFGISKVMTTRVQAQTVLGTPYYISPEMCEGKQYNAKSDIWALGCILYEMACLQKTFEGSNLPALVNKIMAGYFTPIPSGYSRGLSELIHDILQRDPVLRPTADDILQTRLPSILDALQNQKEPLAYNESVPDSSTLKSKEHRSVVYEMDITQGSKCSFKPLPIPPRTLVTELAVSNTHVIILTSERLVYAWGDGKKGSLGNGQSDVWIQDPICIDSLKGKSISHVSAGDGFSVFLSDSGMVITCGDGTFGCLGHGNWDSVTRPRIIEKLLSVDIVLIACGSQHVAAVSVDNQLYTWGRGSRGRLGLGHETDCHVPMLVTMPKVSAVANLRCGADSTALVTQDGALWLCGSNTNNKLGLVKKNPWFLPRKFKGDFSFGHVLTLSKLKGIGCPIKDISMSPTHSAVLTHCNKIFTFGSNIDGQLGQGHAKQNFYGPCCVKFLDDKEVNMVKCGPSFTVASTTENVLYLWGKSFGCTTTENDMASNQAGTWTDLYRSEPYQFSDISPRNPLPNLILVPREVLALYASPNQVLRDGTLFLVNVTPWRQKLIMVVNTTIAVPMVNPSTLTSGRNRNSKNSTEEPDFDSIGPIPNWIKAELAQSEDDWIDLGDSLAI